MRNIKFQSFNAKSGKWNTLAHKSEGDRSAFDKAVTANKAVRVVHPSGSWKVIKNQEALPQTMDTSFVAGR